MRISAGRRDGRGHRASETPCQDAFAVWQGAEGTRAAAAVADGLGSKPLSHFGSQAACDAAVASLGVEAEWDEAALLRAFDAARSAIEAVAAERKLSSRDLATTLQLVTFADGLVHGAMLGDGAVVVGVAEGAAAAEGSEGKTSGEGRGGGSISQEDVDSQTSATTSQAVARAVQVLGPGSRILLAPAQTEYANEVVPVTHSQWKAHVRFAQQEGAQWVMLFTDGLTRLLLSKSRDGWQPFQPFYDAFLPKLQGKKFDESMVGKFLEGANVDKSWDDDKCLVVMVGDGIGGGSGDGSRIDERGTPGHGAARGGIVHVPSDGEAQ